MSCFTAAKVNKAIVLALFFIVQTHSANAQSQAAPQYATPLVEYQGYYKCLQGLTLLNLSIYSISDDTVRAMFSFGPSNLNPYVPRGAYWVQGVIDAARGIMELQPGSWITQPPNFVMVGLDGSSRDHGKTYSGHIVGGQACTSFTLKLTSSLIRIYPVPSERQTITSGQPYEPSSPPPSPNRTQPTRGTSFDKVPLGDPGGVFTVPVSINSVLKLDFILDSGAADVSIPADVVLTLIRTGTISSADFIGSET